MKKFLCIFALFLGLGLLCSVDSSTMSGERSDSTVVKKRPHLVIVKDSTKAVKDSTNVL